MSVRFDDLDCADLLGLTVLTAKESVTDHAKRREEKKDRNQNIPLEHPSVRTFSCQLQEFVVRGFGTATGGAVQDLLLPAFGLLNLACLAERSSIDTEQVLFHFAFICKH